MIITKADIGRKAVSREGREWVFQGLSPNEEYPLRFFPTNGIMSYYFAKDGTFDHDAESIHDLIRWADEAEDAQ